MGIRVTHTHTHTHTNTRTHARTPPILCSVLCAVSQIQNKSSTISMAHARPGFRLGQGRPLCSGRGQGRGGRAIKRTRREASSGRAPSAPASSSALKDFVAIAIWPLVFPALGGYMLSQVIGAKWLEHRSRVLAKKRRSCNGKATPLLPKVDDL